MARPSRAARVDISASIRAPEDVRRGRHRQRQRDRDGTILQYTTWRISLHGCTPDPDATPLYAPDPDSDASVRGEAHHGTGNATKVTGPHDSSASR
jgi:hypothetical protein